MDLAVKLPETCNLSRKMHFFFGKICDGRDGFPRHISMETGKQCRVAKDMGPTHGKFKGMNRKNSISLRFLYHILSKG